MTIPKISPVVPLQPIDFVPASLDLLNGSIPDAFEINVNKYPDKIAALSEGKTITYRELDQRSNGLARRIVHALGVGREPVAILVGHNINALIAILGVLKSGRPYIGLDSTFPAERIREILSDSNTRLTLTDHNNLPNTQETLEAQRVLINIEDDFDGNESRPAISIEPANLAVIYYTSGSTGKPKGVMWSHETIIASSVWQINEECFSPSDRYMLASSIGFAASRSPLFDPLVCGGTICMYDIKTKGTSQVADWLRAEKATIYRSASPLFRSIFSALADDVVFPDLRFVLVGGQSSTAFDVELFRKHTLPHCIFGNHFANTEIGIIANFLVDHKFPITWETVPVAAAPFGDKQILLVDENGQIVPDGEKGEIVIKGRYVSSGYLNLPELNAVKFKKDPNDPLLTVFHTEDVGRWNEAGYLEHYGRKDDTVKIRGYRVDLQEIERTLNQFPSVKDSAAIARPFPNLPDVKQLVAYVVPAAGATVTSRELRTSLSAKLPSYMVPSIYIFLEKLPLLPNGKLDKNSLPDATVRQTLSESDLPINDFEQKLVTIWRKVFHLEMIGVEDNFFELGGDSLLASAMFTAMEREFGKTFPLNLLLEYTTIRRLAAVLHNPTEVEISAIFPLKPGGIYPPLFLFPGGGGDVLTLKELAEALGEDQPVYGIQAVGFFGKSIYARRVEEAAQYFVQEIKKLQPTGPYFLAGHSFGGVIAFEVALQLSSAHDKVGMIGLLDSIPPGSEKSGGAFQRIRTHLKNMQEQGMAQYFTSRLKLRVNKALGRYEFFQRIIRNPRIKPYLWDDPFRQTRFASANYKPSGRYPGTLTIFKVKERPKHVAEDPMQLWKRYVSGPIEEFIVPGEHNSMIKPPHVTDLAMAMNQAMRKTDS